MSNVNPQFTGAFCQAYVADPVLGFQNFLPFWVHSQDDLMRLKLAIEKGTYGSLPRNHFKLQFWRSTADPEIREVGNFDLYDGALQWKGTNVQTIVNPDLAVSWLPR